MNRIKFNLTVLFAVVYGLSACKEVKDQQEKALIISPNLVVVGKKINISYDDSKTLLSGKDNIEGVVYFWQDWHWIASDITLKKKRGLWTADINVPTNAGLMALKFKADNQVDCGGSMWDYVSFTQDTLGQNLPSSYVAWGMLRNKLFNWEYGIPNYVEDSTLIKNDVMLFWCNQELKYHPDERKDVMYFAAKTIGALNKTEKLPLVRSEVENLMTLDSVIHNEKYLAQGIEIANMVLHNTELSTKLEEYALKNYPTGIVARDKEILRIFRLANPEKQTQLLADYVKTYPSEDWQDIETEATKMYLGKIFQAVIYNQVIKYNNYDLLTEYIHELPYDYLYSFFWHMVQVPYGNEQLTAEQVYPHGKLLLDEAFNRPQLKKQQVYSPIEWQNYLLDYRKDALLDWSKVINKLGHKQEAMTWMEKIEPYFEGKSSQFSDFYVQLLEETGDHRKALEVIKTGLSNNAASPEMLDILKTDYIQKNGSDKDFDSYVHSMKNLELTKDQQEHLKASLIDLPIDLFELETLEGQKLNMVDYKGKTLIIDFWATWCAPCKAAMPGMNMAYQKYKDDDDVAFFFISTMETSKDFQQKIHSFIEEKGYEFTVLLDVPNPKNKKRDFVYTQYAKTFKFSGIPQKLIIGPNGNLRWRSTGYEGSPSALADEISYLIELLKSDR